MARTRHQEQTPTVEPAPDLEPTPTPEPHTGVEPNVNPEQTPEQTPEQNSTNATPRKRTPTPDTSDVSPDAIKAAVIANPNDPELGDASEFFAAGQPQRARKPEQLAMDEVAQAAYLEWVKADRPTKWVQMPVVTFYLTDEELPKYKLLIRRACKFATAEGEDEAVKEHLGNEFTLNEKMAEKIGRPDEAGKNVLMWAAVAKRKVAADDKRRQTVETNAAAKADGTAPERPGE